MKQKVILFIESNTSGTGKLFLETCLKIGYKPIILSSNINKYTFKDQVGSWVSIENHEKQTINQEILQIEVDHEIIAVTSTSDFFIQLASEIAVLKDLRSPNLRTIKLCRNKYILRSKLEAKGFNSPAFIRINKNSDLSKILMHMKYPLVVKPINGSGSSQVRLSNNFEELTTSTLEIFSDTTNFHSHDQVLIEEYIGGTEFSAEVFNGIIIGITKKYLGKLPSFVEVGHDFPYIMDKVLKSEIDKSLKSLINTLNLKFGPYHIEFKIFNNKFWLIEINARLAGGYIPSLIKNALGLDLIESTLENLISGTANISFIQKIFSSIRFIIPDKVGYISEISLKGKFSDLNYDYLLYKNLPFEVISIFNDFRDRIGHIITTDNSFEDAKIKAEKLIDRIRLKFKNLN